ncbi:MAG: hypothetical protein GX434_02130 [Peptococcaceae bacterium]|nr:hypothetical protein [Peptococcaceae bacterium]
MKQNQRYNPAEFQRKFFVYRLLQDYYSGCLWQKKDNWNEILLTLAETRYQEEIIFFDLGMRLIQKLTQEAVYDFNRLFVGPEKLLAPPYESAYRNAEGLLMQKETTDVRKFYSIVGLSVVGQNREPDDFIGLELEFLCFLLYQAVSCFQRGEERADFYLNVYFEFLNMHLGNWVSDHCEDVLRHSTSYFCKGMAMLTKGFIEREKSLLMHKEEIL